MQRIICLLLLFVNTTANQGFCQVNSPDPIITVYNYSWLEDENSWNTQWSERTIDIDYQSGNIVNQTHQSTVGSVVVNEENEQFTYNEQGLLTQHTVHEWMSDQWKPFTQHDYSYNEQGIETERIEKRWEDNHWRSVVRYINSYDQSGLRITETKQFWVEEQWSNFIQDSSIYDNQDQLIETNRKEWDNGEWNIKSRGVHNYDVNGNLIEIIGQSRSENLWLNSGKHSYEYDSNDNLVRYTAHNWEGSWSQHRIIFYTYDNLNQLIRINSFFPSLIGDETVYRYYYTENGNLQAKNWKRMIDELEVKSGDSTYYHYDLEFLNDLDVTCFPNPFSNTISISGPHSGEYTIHLRDDSGKLVLAQQASVQDNPSITLNVETLNKGLYILTIIGVNGLVACKKVIKL